MSSWLDTVFFGFDRSVFLTMNNLAVSAGGFFTPFFKFVSLFGTGGLFFIILSLVLLLFKNTRKLGVSILLAVGVGALFTNVLLKNTVARTRPFNASSEYKKFWIVAGCTTQGEYSFPSGHVTVTMTSITALFLGTNKKISWIGFLFVILMALSRVYLIVHYTTDVIGGAMVGGVSGIIAYYLTKLIYKPLNNNPDKKFCSFVLNADLRTKLKRK